MCEAGRRHSRESGNPVDEITDALTDEITDALTWEFEPEQPGHRHSRESGNPAAYARGKTTTLDSRFRGNDALRCLRGNDGAGTVSRG